MDLGWYGSWLCFVIISFFCYLYCSLDAKKSLICLAGKWIETWRDTYRLSQLLIPNSNTKIILQNHNHKVSDYPKLGTGKGYVYFCILNLFVRCYTKSVFTMYPICSMLSAIWISIRKQSLLFCSVVYYVAEEIAKGNLWLLIHLVELMQWCIICWSFLFMWKWLKPSSTQKVRNNVYQT